MDILMKEIYIEKLSAKHQKMLMSMLYRTFLLYHNVYLEQQKFNTGLFGRCWEYTYCGFTKDRTVKLQVSIEFFVDLPYLRIKNYSQQRNIERIYSIGSCDPVEFISKPW